MAALEIPQQYFSRFVGGAKNLPNFLDLHFTSCVYVRFRPSRSVNSGLSASSAVQTEQVEKRRKEKEKKDEMKRK